MVEMALGQISPKTFQFRLPILIPPNTQTSLPSGVYAISPFEAAAVV
jgi:hypothetical protein